MNVDPSLGFFSSVHNEMNILHTCKYETNYELLLIKNKKNKQNVLMFVWL